MKGLFMIHRKRNSSSTKPRKTDISALFLPVPLTFDDLRREWRSCIEQEAAATSVGLREYWARQRTRLLESFPAYEVPSLIDRLNAPLKDAEEVAHAI